MRMDPALIIHHINCLLVQCPELEEDEQLRADMIEGETNLNEFLRDMEAKRRDAAAMAGAIATTITDLEQRLARLERREQAMRRLMHKLMEAADLKKIELPEATLSIRNGTPKVIITDETLIPEILCRIKREPDKQRIGQLLKEGSPVQGAELSNAEPNLTIRTK